MNKRDKIRFIFDYLKKLFPNPKTELEYSTPFQLVVAVILSAQTTDKQVNKVTKELFKIVKKPSDVIELGEKRLIESIKTIGLYKGKGKNIYLLSNIIISKNYINEFNKKASDNVKRLYKKHGYYISDQIADLKKLPGVGEKTAKVISHVLYNAKVIAVDTHVHRVSNRLGLVKTNSPEQTSKLLENVIENKYKNSSHHSLVLFGRYHCKALKPNCVGCELKQICKYYNDRFGLK